MAPSTFASAAAGTSSSQNPTRDAASDWSRRTNGATQTFRRPSGATTTPTTTSHPHDDSSTQQPRRYVPPHRNGTLPDTRYSKDQLLDIYRAQQSVDGSLHDGLPDLFVGGWHPDIANGTPAGWGRTDHSRDAQPGQDACWDRDGVVEPLGLVDMDEEERELFATTVNTPIKPATTKDGQQTNGMPARKISISGGSGAPGGYGLPSPSVTRGGGRRRETSESYPFPANNVSSPGGYGREDGRAPSPPPSILRRRTDLKDLNKSEDSNGDEKGASSPFGSLRRNPTGPLSAGFNAPASPWTAGPQSAALSPMGSFGNFGMGSNSGQQGPPSEKRPGLGSARSESRFKNVLGKDGGEEGASKTIERKTSISSLSRVNENESWRLQDRMEPANEPLDETEEDLPIGSAALAADADLSPPHHRQGFRGFGTPSRQATKDDFGFGAFGMTSDHTHGFGPGILPGRDSYHQTPGQSRMGLQPGNEPMSPTDTNPYQSPEQHGVDRMGEDGDNESNEPHNNHLPGLGQFGVDSSQQLGGLGGLGAIHNLGRAHGQGPASDRSQTSSAGPNRGFSGLPGLGGLASIGGGAGWPASQGGIGTPGRQTSGLSGAFPGGIFANQMSDLQSPALAGLGGSSMMGPAGGAYGGSRMASMFPPQMQDQMRQTERDGAGERPAQPFGALGDFGRATESPFANQGFNDTPSAMSMQEDAQRLQMQQQGGGLPDQAPGLNQPPASSASSQPPAPQQRTMVMPDRMRWIYKDPQGQTQGPWSGLEMHDWYKAGFFSPELLVKKYEDPDYEPLAQLIRRIGNSREPFLVPQIGIPHGPAGTNPGPAPWAGSVASPGSAQPPFASSFPSFGTTLTAEQQNALERRKQEEQYLMARQKEHLAQAQIAQRMQMPPHQGMMQGQLHHHSSAHSLQSQPSFGSITSPSGYQPSPVTGPTAATSGPHPQGFFDNSFRASQGGHGAVGAPSLGHIREEELPGIIDRMNLGERQQAGQFGAPGQPFAGQQAPQQSLHQDPHEGTVQQMFQDRTRLQQEQAEYDASQQGSEQQQALTTAERLEQFHQLRAKSQHEAQDQEHPISPAPEQHRREASAPESSVGSPVVRAQEVQQPQEPLSLTEQVQKAASAKQSPAPQQPGLPQPFPPAPSQSPLPAPAAQRAGRQSVADQLQTDTRDASQTPSVDTPSATIAPWAKEPTEAPRGPSLKEIQENEARKAAEREEAASAARRAQFQREMEAQAQAAAPPPPGIPASATWGAPSPATPTGSVSAAWAKTAQKPTGPTSSKTLAQIQKEEEARKRRAANAALQQAQANAMSNFVAPAGTKSYANLAGKVIAPPAQGNVAGGAWTTVGASGKTKTPAPAPTPGRAVSASVVPTVQPPVPRKVPARSTTMANTGAVNAVDEFKKWAVMELRPDLKNNLNAESFVSELMQYPPEMDILVDAVHISCDTIDSRHFAEEWIRRKRLADKGIFDASVLKSASPANAAVNSGGWSEVAKKGPSKEQPKEEANGNFRMVPSKKRGGKR